MGAGWIAASTASYGVAAGVGLAAFLAAIASGAAVGVASSALGGAATTLHEGGNVRRRRMHSGGLAHDEVPIIAQEGEFMIQRNVAQQPGMMDMLMAINAGMFHSGGRIRRLHEGGNKFNPLVGDFTPIAENLPFPNETSIGDYPNYNAKYEGPPDHGGPQVITPTDRSGYQRNELGIDSSSAARFLSSLTGFGTSPSSGAGVFGPTMLDTFWTNYPGVGNVPMAVPVGGWPDPSGTGTSQQLHAGFSFKPHHSGGPIGRFPRFHSGGSLARVGGGGASRPVIHVNNFTDPKAMLKAVSTQQGQKIIVDTVRGRSIDLGL